MFSAALIKRFEKLPEISPKEAESKYWAKPHVDYGRALKLAHMASGLKGEDVNAARVAIEAGEAVTAARAQLDEQREEISRMCLSLGVDPEQSLSEIVDAVVDIAQAEGGSTSDPVETGDDTDEGESTGDLDAPTDADLNKVDAPTTADSVPKVPEGSQR